MPAWVTLTEDDVLSGMTSREIDDFAKVSAGISVPDRVTPILADLVAEIQGMIASRADNPAPPDAASIPSEFKARAVSIARWRILISIPGYQPGDARKMDYEKADAFFVKVAEGKIRPRAEATDGAPAAIPTAGAWNSENKILGRAHPTPRPGDQSSGPGRYANDDAPQDDTYAEPVAETAAAAPATAAEMLASIIIGEVAAMVAGKVPADTMHLFSNTTPEVTDYASYTPNANLWCAPWRDKLTGVHMYMSGGWAQSYAFQPVTRRHLLSCAHSRDSRVGVTVRWVSADGTETCERTITRQVNDFQSAFCSDTQQTAVADVMICLIDEDLPDWVHVPPVIILSDEVSAAFLAAGVPCLIVSQGNPNVMYASDPYRWPEHNRRVYLRGIDTTPLPAPFADFDHGPTIGDSGTNKYLKACGDLCLYSSISSAGTSGPILGDYVDYLDSLILRADVADSISTGYSVRTVNPLF